MTDASSGPIPHHYVPVIRASPADLRALGTVSVAMQRAMRPLIEVPPPPVDPLTQHAKYPVAEQLARRWTEIGRAWLSPAPIMLDLGLLDASSATGGNHVVTEALHLARQTSRRVVPVTAPERTPEFRTAVRQALEGDHEGLCFRINASHLRDAAHATALFSDELAFYGVPPSAVDVVVDARAVRRNLSSATLATRWRAMLATVPTPTAWRSLSIVGTTRPSGLSGVRELQLLPNASLALARLARTEWTTWLAMIRSHSRGTHVMARVPSFGDYVLVRPDFVPFDPRVLKPVAQIWYSRAGAWLVLRGRRIREYGSVQYRRLARELVAQREFRDPTFSVGDQYISDVAARVEAPKSPGRWRESVVSHHLMETLHGLARIGRVP